jgi:hypothetical protein
MKLSSTALITIVGVTSVLLYIIVQLLKLYDVDLSVYGKYIMFYLFILLSLFILPMENQNITNK